MTWLSIPHLSDAQPMKLGVSTIAKFWTIPCLICGHGSKKGFVSSSFPIPAILGRLLALSTLSILLRLPLKCLPLVFWFRVVKIINSVWMAYRMGLSPRLSFKSMEKVVSGEVINDFGVRSRLNYRKVKVPIICTLASLMCHLPVKRHWRFNGIRDKKKPPRREQENSKIVMNRNLDGD